MFLQCVHFCQNHKLKWILQRISKDLWLQSTFFNIKSNLLYAFKMLLRVLEPPTSDLNFSPWEIHLLVLFFIGSLIWGLKYYSKLEQSESYWYLHTNMRTVAWYFCYFLSLFCLVMTTEFQGQRDKIRPCHIEERLCWMKGKRRKKKRKMTKPWVCENCSQYTWKQ